MSALPPDAWVPVPMRYRYVIAGDVFIDPRGRLWVVNRSGGMDNGHWAVVATHADVPVRSAEVDPDDMLNVMVPVTEVDAVELTRAELGARLVGRRTEPAA